MSRNLIAIAIAIAASIVLVFAGCSSPEGSTSPADEVSQDANSTAASEQVSADGKAGAAISPPPVDSTLPENPVMPPNTDPNAPPMDPTPIDPTQIPPTSPEEPAKQTMLPEPLPTS